MLESGAERFINKGGNMHKKLALFTVVAVLGVIGAGAAVAGRPDDPGCFGQDRAAYLHENFQNGGAMDTAPGASEWGAIAGERAETNGDMNRAYKTGCGGDPS